VGITHFSLDLGPGNKRGNRVHNNHIDRSAPYKSISDLEGLFAGIRLRDQKIVDIDPQFSGVFRVERMFGVYKSRDATRFLAAGNNMKRQGCLSGRFGTIHLCHPSTGHTTDSGGYIEVDGSRRESIDLDLTGLCPQLHYRTLTVLPFDLT